MTPTEYKLFATALKWYARNRRDNPDVGIGPSAYTLVQDMEQETGVMVLAAERPGLVAIAQKEL